VYFVGYLYIAKIKLCLYTKLVQVHISWAHLQKRILTLTQKRILAVTQSRNLADNGAELFPWCVQCRPKQDGTIAYWCETWSFVVREWQTVRMLENSMLTALLIPKRKKKGDGGNYLTLILLTWRIGWAHNNARK